jgi:nucleotide-binding universal stress UspA family protein
MVVIAAVAGETRPDAVVSVGYDLASTYGTELVALSVMTNDEFESRQGSIAGYAYERAVTDAAGKAQQVVAETLESTEGVTTVGAVGNPTDEILAAGREREAKYLVVGGRKRTPTGKALFGSTTQSVLLSADRPVVTVMSE